MIFMIFFDNKGMNIIRTFWKPQILSEINKVPNLALSHIWFLCESNSIKKNRKFNFLWMCK